MNLAERMRREISIRSYAAAGLMSDLTAGERGVTLADVEREMAGLEAAVSVLRALTMALALRDRRDRVEIPTPDEVRA